MKTPTPTSDFAPRVRTVASILCASLIIMMPMQAQARGTVQGEIRIAECIRQAAGGHPWLERTLWGLRDQEGGWIGAQVRNTNGSHDLGPLQVNSWWVPKIAGIVGRSQADVRAWLTSDPCFNAGAARWIFLSAFRETRDFWRAIGIYHSPTAWRQKRYALSVAGHMQRRFGRDIFMAPAVPRIVKSVTGGIGGGGIAAPVRSYGFGVVQEPPG